MQEKDKKKMRGEDVRERRMEREWLGECERGEGERQRKTEDGRGEREED